jgi:two-component system, OmpR family, sensor histidine kinase CiaH
MAEPHRPDVFARAQSRLALLFVTLVIVIIVVTSVLLYFTVKADLSALAQRTDGGGDGETEQEYVTRRLGTLRWQVVAVDAVLVVIIGAGGLMYARRTLKPIRDNVAAQKQFVADASHDLRTPLAIMKAEFEVALRRPDLDDAARPVLASGLEEVDRMSGMVDDLLTLSRIDAHQESLAREPLDLAALARATAAELATLAAAGGVELRAGGDDAVITAGDEDHVRRALRNVVRNAVEHSPRGSVVEVDVRRTAGRGAVVVADRGDGMPPEVLEHVFDRFYRADAARSREHGGSGLGLAIAYWALRGMGGDLRVDSRVGEGTRVTLSLPVA